MGEMEEVVKEFLVESYENLDRLDSEMIQLEERPQDLELLASIFRTIHTIKGTCGFLGFGKLESVAHVGESLLSKLREGKLTVDEAISNALLALVDAVREMLKSIEDQGAEGGTDYSALVATLTALNDGKLPAAPKAESAPKPANAPAPAQSTANTPAPRSAPTTDGEPKLGRILVDSGAAQPAEVREALAAQSRGDTRPLGEILVQSGTMQPEQLHEALAGQSTARGNVSDGNIRVDVALLDKLMNLVGELVLARNQLMQHSGKDADPQIAATTQRLDLVTTELQEGVMKTRMQPVGTVWSKFPRVVRDLSKLTHKEVRLEMEGKETELDRTIIEAIKDPLTHIIRNCVDHGIETPAVRKAAGKNPEGCILLRACHEGGQVNIEIVDDGGGVPPERVKAKALERGLITPEQAARMSEREIVNLIFLPGFSTAAQVSNISGRGVGMDVVKTNIEKIGGSVDVQSVVGKGTRLKLKIPLTLAIIPGLIVTTAGDRYAIPQVSLLELLRLEPEQLASGIEYVQGVPVHRLRGRLLPLVHLGGELGVAPSELKPDQAINIVVLQSDGRQFGLIVDEVNDAEEIVVKPLSKQLKSIEVYAGATIMGDGQVALILDIAGLAQQAHAVSELKEQARSTSVASGAAVASDRETLLVCRSGREGRIAIPLSTVARLEEFPRSALELAGGRDAVQYRGEIMPLLQLSSIYGSAVEASEANLQVVVYTRKGRSLGLVVEQILDIVEEHCVVQAGTRRTGTLGAAILQQKVTDLVDVEGLVREHDPSFFDEAVLQTAGA